MLPPFGESQQQTKGLLSYINGRVALTACTASAVCSLHAYMAGWKELAELAEGLKIGGGDKQ